ncbi:DUF4905 domain-containing protein [Pedobacter sp. P351]|uniref:DUF4905 domain-containing protein n=1 Tax=Pedobacter superstes TaxID=3133441 RepID=UPI0030A7D9E0
MSTVDKYTLKPSLSETFKSIIWKIETDDTDSIIALETRNPADRTSHFSAYNFVTGECLFKEITVEDSWNWGLDKVHKGIVFLHSYVHESNPEHKGIIAINGEGNIAWQQFNKTLYEVTNKGLLVYNPKIQPKIFELISASDGSSCPEKELEAKPVDRTVIVPEIISDVSFLNHLLPQNYIGPVFYKEYNHKSILVYHIKSGSLFNQQLAVYQGGNLILEDNLAMDIQKLNPEAFFIDRDHMFCIRNNKKQFVSYLV